MPAEVIAKSDPLRALLAPRIGGVEVKHAQSILIPLSKTS
jgi:hypothetical protein